MKSVVCSRSTQSCELDDTNETETVQLSTKKLILEDPVGLARPCYPSNHYFCKLKELQNLTQYQ